MFEKKYCPDQPRDENGRWNGGSGSCGGEWEGIDDPPIEPVYPIETALAVLTGGEALAAMRGAMSLWEGVESADEEFDDIAKSLEDYFGGIPDKTFRNSDDDLIMMGNDKKIRFYIEDPHGYDPHFHIEELDGNGNWVDATDKHMNFFKKAE